MNKLVDYKELEKRMQNFNLSYYQATICKNIKRIRKDLYESNKNSYNNNKQKNPYSAQCVAELLGISYEYYKRLESFDKSKPISLKLVVKVMVLFDCTINDLFKN